MSKEKIQGYIHILEDGLSIEFDNLCACPIHTEPMTGYPLEKVHYQVTYYDRYRDFEISSFHDDPFDAVEKFLSILDIISRKVSEGKRAKSSMAKYNKIYEINPSAYGDVGKIRLKSKRSRRRSTR